MSPDEPDRPIRQALAAFTIQILVPAVAFALWALGWLLTR